MLLLSPTIMQLVTTGYGAENFAEESPGFHMSALVIHPSELTAG